MQNAPLTAGRFYQILLFSIKRFPLRNGFITFFLFFHIRHHILIPLPYTLLFLAQLFIVFLFPPDRIEFHAAI